MSKVYSFLGTIDGRTNLAVLSRTGHLEPRRPAKMAYTRHAMRDPIELEVLKNLYHSIAEEMGAALRRTSFSPNIKERRD